MREKSLGTNIFNMVFYSLSNLYLREVKIFYRTLEIVNVLKEVLEKVHSDTISKIDNSNWDLYKAENLLLSQHFASKLAWRPTYALARAEMCSLPYKIMDYSHQCINKNSLWSQALLLLGVSNWYFTKITWYVSNLSMKQVKKYTRCTRSGVNKNHKWRESELKCTVNSRELSFHRIK